MFYLENPALYTIRSLSYLNDTQNPRFTPSLGMDQKTSHHVTTTCSQFTCQHLGEVGLLPPLPAAVRQKAPVIRSGRNTARAAEEAAKTPTKAVLEHAIQLVAAQATPAALSQASLDLLLALLVLDFLLLLQLLEIGLLKVALELDHDVLVEPLLPMVEPQNDEKKQSGHQVNQLLQQEIVLQHVTHQPDTRVVLGNTYALHLGEAVNDHDLDAREKRRQNEQQQIGGYILLRLVLNVKEVILPDLCQLGTDAIKKRWSLRYGRSSQLLLVVSPYDPRLSWITVRYLTQITLTLYAQFVRVLICVLISMLDALVLAHDLDAKVLFPPLVEPVRVAEDR